MTWRDIALYDKTTDDLVQVLCRVTKPTFANPNFPRACELPISSGDDAEGDLFVSIGFLLAEPIDGQPWSVAGWNMSQDCWQDAHCFEVIGWQPLARAETPHDQ